MRVTLTEMPRPMTSAMAGMPALVAGIFTRRFSRPTVSYSFWASATVASVSCASSGDTSIDTRPSKPPVRS